MYNQQLTFKIPDFDDGVLPVAGHDESVDRDAKAQNLVSVFLQWSVVQVN